jgi:hypothetical protein
MIEKNTIFKTISCEKREIKKQMLNRMHRLQLLEKKNLKDKPKLY